MKLIPSCAVGIGFGSQLVGGLTASQSKLLVGVLLACILVLNFIEEYKKRAQDTKKSDDAPKVPAYAQSFWFTSCVGLLGGFATILTNSMGPLLNAFFVLPRLDTIPFVATRATFFTTVNTIKVA